MSAARQTSLKGAGGVLRGEGEGGVWIPKGNVHANPGGHVSTPLAPFIFQHPCPLSIMSSITAFTPVRHENIVSPPGGHASLSFIFIVNVTTTVLPTTV